MNAIRYARIPVKCHNGHPAYWHVDITADIGQGVLKIDNTSPSFNGTGCTCPTLGEGRGYVAAAPIELATGLQDANGTRIYENDVLTDGNKLSAETTIRWSDRYAGFRGFYTPEDEHGVALDLLIRRGVTVKVQP